MNTVSIMKHEKRIHELEQIIRQLPLNDALHTVFEEFSLKKEAVAKRAFMPVEYLYRYINKSVIPELDNLVKLLLAMDIPFRLSDALLYTAGYVLRSNDRDVMYSVLLENHKAVGGVIEANEMIEEYNRTAGKQVIPLFKLK